MCEKYRIEVEVSKVEAGYWAGEKQVSVRLGDRRAAEILRADIGSTVGRLVEYLLTT